MTAVDKNRIQQLNKMAQERNAERQMQLGRQDSAKQAYTKAVAMYEAQYGVKITPENLQEVYNSVVAELTKQANELEQKIADVDNQINEAVNKPVGGIDTSQPVVETVSQPDVQPVSQSVPSETPTVRIEGQPLDLNAQLAKLAVTTQASPVENPSIPTQGIEEEAVAPTGWGVPSGDINNVFANILNNK